MSQSNSNSMNEKEKRDLRKRIISSSYPYRNKTRRRYYNVCAAACVVILLSVGLYTFNTPQVPITKFAQSSQNLEFEPTTEVQLLYNGNKKLAIGKNNASITYTANGRGVRLIDSLGSGQEIALDDSSVFNTIMVPYGQRTKIVLSDGTEVWLNSGSKLIYPPSFTAGESREVYLKGEAIFDVAHDTQHPFKVLSEGHTIEVLGTVFNVSSYPDDTTIRTVLKSGSVEISHSSDSFFKSQKSTKILPGMMAVYDKNMPGVETRNVDVDNYFSWREGTLIFKNNSLNYIMKKLDRYYNVSINFEQLNMEDETFSGHLDLKDSIESVLNILQETTSFDYSYNENGTILINKPDDM